MDILRRWHYNETSVPFTMPSENLVIVCVGTDRSTGDALGPLVGYMLKLAGVPSVYGCIDDPIHALNLPDRLEVIKENHPDAIIIGVDASLGSAKNVGWMTLRKSPLKPGTGVGKILPAFGHYSITGVVNRNGFGYTPLPNTRLSLVFSMANSVVDFILDSITAPLSEVAATEVS